MAAASRRLLRVLIVDAYDERDMYAEALVRHGFDVLTASTAIAALKLVTRTPPDVVVQGSMFPDLSGIGLTRRLKSLPQTRSAPLIVLSGFSDQATLGLIREGGCDSILVTPCLPEALLQEVQRLAAGERLRLVRGKPVKSRERTLGPARQGRPKSRR
jgi:two-component system cell cycle response regulator DivK